MIQVAKPEYREGVNGVYFPYLIGETWAEKLGEEISGGKLPLATLSEAMDQVYDIAPEYRGAFVRTPEFDEVFGQGLTEEELALLEQDTSCMVSNIDALFENMLLTKDGIFCLDYEWVFLFPVPEHFVKYRILLYFYERWSLRVTAFWSKASKKASSSIKASSDTSSALLIFPKVEIGGSTRSRSIWLIRLAVKPAFSATVFKV